MSPLYPVNFQDKVKLPSEAALPPTEDKLTEVDKKTSEVSETLRGEDSVEGFSVVHRPADSIQPSGLAPVGVRGTYFEFIPSDVRDILTKTLRHASLERRENLVLVLKEFMTGNKRLKLVKKKGELKLITSNWPNPNGYVNKDAAFFIIKELEIYQKTKNLDFLGANEDQPDLYELIKESGVLKVIDKPFRTLLPTALSSTNLLNSEFLIELSYANEMTKKLSDGQIKVKKHSNFENYVKNFNDKLDFLNLFKTEISREGRLDSFKDTLLVSQDETKNHLFYLADIKAIVNNPSLLDELISKIEGAISGHADNRTEEEKKSTLQDNFPLNILSAQLYGKKL